MLFFNNGVLGQQLFNVSSITQDDGLSFRHVNFIAQDSNGLMWFGTNNGLSRYDGYRFLNFGIGPNFEKHFPATEFKRNGCIVKNDSILWIIGDNKLHELNYLNFKVNAIKEISEEVFNICIGKHKDIWLSSSNDTIASLWYYNDTIGFKKIASAKHNILELWSISVDTFGNAWWSSATKGLQQFNTEGKLLFETKLDSFDWYGNKLYLTELFHDNNNQIYFFKKGEINRQGIYKYSSESLNKAPILTDIENEFLIAAKDNRGQSWFAHDSTINSVDLVGLNTNFDDNFTEFLDYTNINDIFFDQFNILWVATDGGLLKMSIRKNQFDHSFAKSGAGWGNAMRGITEDSNGNLIFYCENGDIGLNKKVNDKIISINCGLVGEKYYNIFGSINHIEFDSRRNSLWAMTQSLIEINIDNNSYEIIPGIAYSPDVSNFNPLLLLENGNLLIGNTLDQMVIYNPISKTVSKVTLETKEDISTIKPKVFIAQDDNSYWVGTEKNGVYLIHVNGEILRHYDINSRPALQSNYILSLYKDPITETLWIGTFGAGLNSIDISNEFIEAYNDNNGLANNYVASIENDGQNLWLGTYYGLSCLNKKDKTFKNFYVEDGLKHNEFNYASSYQSNDGKMHFGGMNGINSFNPIELLEETINPPIVITKITFDDQELEMSLDKINSVNQNIEIFSNVSTLQIDWTLPNYYKPEKNQYFYWLEGLEETWSYLGNLPSLRYNKLPAGKYTLHLNAKDSRGTWASDSKEINFLVLAPWYRTYWAYSIYLISFVGLLGFIRKLELKRFKLQNQLHLEHIESERLRELDLEKSQFFANVSHEFKTPLTVILGSAKEISKPKAAKDLIIRSSQKLLQLVTQILDLGKLESGKLLVNLQREDIISFLKYLLESFNSLAEHKHQNIHFESSVRKLEMEFDEEKVQHIVSNLLSNAIKFTPKYGMIKLIVNIKSDQNQNLLEIAVTDNGIGIDSENLPKIFERYYKINDNKINASGTGIGLAFTKDLVQLLQGSISAESTKDIGTTLKVILPINKGFKIEHGTSTYTSIINSQHEHQAIEGLTETSDGNYENLLPVLLLIEDNPEVVSYIQIILGDLYTIITAENGEAGISKAYEYIPDIIISDVMMPIKDGFEVTDTLKNNERTCHIPIVLLTAKGDTDSRLIGLERGADAYLSKPFDKTELKVRLRKLLELRKRLHERYNDFSDDTINQSQTIFEDGFILKLKKIIEENLANPDFNVQDICKEVNMSRSQLYRKLHALTGKTIVPYLRSMRMHRAKEMIIDTDMNISEVAYAVGFNDPSYFTRVYSKEFGYTPSEESKN